MSRQHSGQLHLTARQDTTTLNMVPQVGMNSRCILSE